MKQLQTRPYIKLLLNNQPFEFDCKEQILVAIGNKNEYVDAGVYLLVENMHEDWFNWVNITTASLDETKIGYVDAEQAVSDLGNQFFNFYVIEKSEVHADFATLLAKIEELKDA